MNFIRNISVTALKKIRNYLVAFSLIVIGIFAFHMHSFTYTFTLQGPLLGNYELYEPLLGFFLRDIVKGNDLVIFVIDSPGGYTRQTLDLIHDIQFCDAKTVAVVPRAAYSSAALITMSTTMRYINPNATLIFHRSWHENRHAKQIRANPGDEIETDLADDFMKTEVFQYMTPEQQKAYLNNQDVEVTGKQLHDMGATESLGL